MTTINELKEQELLDTPLLLFECALADGQVERWSTHRVTVDGAEYQARVLQHNLFDISLQSEDGVDNIATVGLSLANADGHFSQVERNTGWKGAKLAARFVFFDLQRGQAASETRTLFRGIANPPERITESTMRLTFQNRMNLQRVLLPQVRIQKRCPWMFPEDAAKRAESVHGGSKGKYSLLFRCGYSPDQEGGTGNLNGDQPYEECNYTRQDCEQRGMFSKDSLNRDTRRFGGVEFVPSSVLVRTHGDKTWHESPVTANEARYNDFVPLVYGTGWQQPPITLARNDGNLTHLELLLGMGEIQGVLKVLVNDIEIPAGRDGDNMSATGWYNLVSRGNRTGDFNYDFADGGGLPAGDPYGSMAVLSVAVPNRVSDGRNLPRVQVLMEGLKISRYDTSGDFLGDAFSNNPAWILLDVLRRSGWEAEEIDLGSFARVAEGCAEAITVQDAHGNPVTTAKYGCNLVLRKRKSASEVVRGIRNTAAIYLAFGTGGKLTACREGSMALQQPAKPEGSNASEPLAGGWPAYEFGDGAMGSKGILRNAAGEPQFRLWSRPMADSPNRMSLEFQDELNEYQQDSVSLVNYEDVLRSGQETSVTVSALGMPNPDQAVRIVKRQLHKSVGGNLFVEFETSVRAIHLRPGDLIAITYLKEGLERKPFRVVQIRPQNNFRTARITAQAHEDAWYSDEGTGWSGYEGRQPQYGVGLPRPLGGVQTGADGEPEFGIEEAAEVAADGTVGLALSVSFRSAATPSRGKSGIPILNLSPTIAATGGTLRGDQTLYYAVTALGAEGGESELSFTAKATIPAGGNTNTITLCGISLPQGATGMNVYRGRSPQELLQVGANLPPGTSYIDNGAAGTMAPPPDANYDHANFYWRMELLGEQSAGIATATSIGNAQLQMQPGEYAGQAVRIISGKGAGQERIVEDNSATEITITQPWHVVPDNTSRFTVAEAGWRYGATGKHSPVRFSTPNRQGATVQVTGRAANAEGKECGPELSPVTRWRLKGGEGSGGDEDVPPAPLFGLSTAGQGLLEVGGIAFPTLENTRTATAGTLTLHYWDELESPSPFTLAAPMDSTVTTLDLNGPGDGAPDDLLQVERELMSIEEVQNGGLRYLVRRASHGSVAAIHALGTPVYHLSKRVSIMPFGKGFFGSPASGRFSFAAPISNARIGAAELFISNAHGNSPATYQSYTGTSDGGLRTMCGGQICLQVDGPLAIEDDAAPPWEVEGDHAIREVFAMVKEAPTGAPLLLRVRRAGATLCELTIPAGQAQSNVVDGFGMEALTEGTRVTLDIVSVSPGAEDSPGRDLTVVVRL
jgi:hypothetical protein